MVQYALILLHVAQCVLLPFGALSVLLQQREQVPLDENSNLWWVLLACLIAAIFSVMTYSWAVGFFDAQHFSSLFVDRDQTRAFLTMVLVPVAWLVAAALVSPAAYADSAREAGVVVFCGHHVVLACLRLWEAVRTGDALPLIAWRLWVALALTGLGALLCWVWGSQLSPLWFASFVVALGMELTGSVPFYRRHVTQIFSEAE